MSHTQIDLNPLRGSLISKIRLISLPMLMTLLFIFVGSISSEISWRRNLLGISFLCYYVFVTLFGMLRVSSIVEELLGETSEVLVSSNQMLIVRHSVRVYFSLWITGGLAILAGLIVAMNKPRWDMPVPLPALQILSSVLWAVLSSLYLHYLAFVRSAQLHRSSNLNFYFLRSGLLYSFLILLFPLYFILYAGNGKIMNIPYLIIFTFPTNILFIYLLSHAKTKIKQEYGDLINIFFPKDTFPGWKRIIWLFAFTFAITSAIFLDYARYRKILWTYAAKENLIFLFRPLRLVGTGMSERDEHGYTPLLWAVHGNAIDFVDYCLENGSDVDVVNNFGQTPVIVAVLSQNLIILKQLSEKGANLNYVEPSEGYTALSLAARDGNFEIVKYLLDSKVKREGKNKQGKSAFELAKQNGHEAIAKLFQ